MIRKAARTNLTRAVALLAFNEAKTKPGAIVEMIEQDGGLWTVTIVWDDTGAPVDPSAVSGFEKADAPAPTRAAAAAAVGGMLGSLSQRFESNGKPGAIGHDSTGGFSYGAYQIATATGTMDAFLKFLKSGQPAFASALADAGGATGARSGSQGFFDAWRALAADPKFLQAQHDFIGATHYIPFSQRLLARLNLDIAQRSAVLRDVAWSVAVQHGPANKVFDNALAGQDLANMTDRTLIDDVYAERSNISRYFSSSTAQVKSALLARFTSERALALSRLA
jgi:type VI secretion system (T6SS) spike protein VgrG3